MKKLLKLSFDIILFSFLILIFLIPFVVSLNLDPKLYEKPNSDVAGVSTSIDETSSYIEFSEFFKSNDRLFIRNSTYQNNTYKIDFKYTKGDRAENTFELGKINNSLGRDITVNIDIWGPENNFADLLIDIKVNDQEYNLLENSKSTNLNILIPSNSNSNIYLDIKSKQTINYDRNFNLILKPVILP